MDISKKEIPQRWVEASPIPSTPAPEIVRIFVSELTGPFGLNTLVTGRVFRSYGVNDSSLGASERRASTPPSNEKNPRTLDFISEGTD